MGNPLVVIHGWSDTFESFVPMRTLMAPYGYATADVWLGNYQSMHDDITFDDLAEGLDTRLRALESKGIKLNPYSLDLIVHSTGGPVVRHWLAGYVASDGVCPVRSLVIPRRWSTSR